MAETYALHYTKLSKAGKEIEYTVLNFPTEAEALAAAEENKQRAAYNVEIRPYNSVSEPTDAEQKLPNGIPFR